MKPSRLLVQDQWRTLFALRFDEKEHITHLECRAAVSAVRRTIRSKYGFGYRHLHLGDNLGLVLGLGRGRCNSFPLLSGCRRILGLSAASGSRFKHRWFPSDRNTVDKKSRLWEPFRRRHGSSFFRPCARSRFQGFG